MNPEDPFPLLAVDVGNSRIKLGLFEHAAADDRLPGPSRTLLVDARTGRVRYSIPKHLDDPKRRKEQRRYMAGVVNSSLYAAYFRGVHEQEPFAALHRF